MQSLQNLEKNKCKILVLYSKYMAIVPGVLGYVSCLAINTRSFKEGTRSLP